MKNIINILKNNKKKVVIIVAITGITISVGLKITIDKLHENGYEIKYLDKTKSKSNTLFKPNYKEESINKSQEEVKKRLKCPSTAKFSECDSIEVSTEKEPRKFIINGKVDSQNGFGAMIRSEFFMTIRLDENGKVFKVDECKIY